MLSKLFSKNSKNNYRAPRVQLLPLHRLKFSSSEHHNSEILIGNISESGIGFIKKTFPQHSEMPEILDGTLKIGEDQFLISIQIIHITNTIVGGKYVGDKNKIQSLQVAIHQFLNLELKALNMLEVKQELLQKTETGVPHWFRGENNCELYLIEGSQNELIHFHISFFGNYFEFNKGEKEMKSGVVIDDLDTDSEEEGFKPKHRGASLVSLDDSQSKAGFDAAIRFVKNIKNLSEAYRSEICIELEKSEFS